MDESGRSTTGIAGDHARSSGQLAREHDRLKLLLDINNATVSHLALDELLHTISESLQRVVPHDISGIGLYDPETRQLRAQVLEYPGDLPIFARGTPIPMEGTTGGLAFTTGRPVFISEPDFERFNSDYARKTFEAGFNSGGSIPLTAHGRKLGVLGVASRRENAFSEDDIEMLCQVGNQIAIAVENSLNYEKARDAERELALKLDHLQLLLDVSNGVTSHLDLGELFHAISECLKKVIKCDGGALTFYDPETRQLRAVALEPGPGIAGKLPVELGEAFELEGTPGELAITTGRSVLVKLADLERGTSPVSQRAIAAGIKSGCAVPLISHGRVLGTLDVVSRDDDAFTEKDAEVLTQIAREIAIAVENALNFENARVAQQQLARERDRLTLMLEVNSAVTGQLELQELLKVISVCLRRVINHDAASVTIYNPETNLLHFHALETQVLGEHLLRDGAYYSIEDTPSGVAFTTRRTVLFRLPELEKFSMPLIKLIVANGLKSAVCAPLISQGRVFGTLDIGSLQKEFTEEEAELLSQIAGQIAIAVDNALNFDRALKAEQEMARARERSELLLEINNKIASSLDLRELFKAISTCLRTVLHHDYADLGYYDPETDRMRLYAIDSETDVPHEQEGVWWPVEGTPAGAAIRLRQTIVRTRHDPSEFPSELMTRAFEAGLRSGIAVPLISRERVLGVLIVASGREAAFTAEDGELLTQIGVQVAMAVENAINFEAVRSAELQAARERDRSELLLKINNAIVSHLDLRELMYVVSSYLRDALRHDLVGLALYDPETDQLRASTYDFPDNQLLVKEGQPIPLEGSMTGLTFTSGKPVIVNRFDDERFPSDFNKSFRAAGFKSGCCVPLIAHGRKLGTLGVTNYKEDVFSEGEMGLLVQIGNQIAIALENALAYREIESLKNKLSEEKLYLEEEINTAYGFEQLIGSSPGLKRILKQVQTVAPTDSTVLIQGETGTGKELIARAIHSLSARRERTLVKLNCAAIPTGLLESELFGHEKGAFTGAIAQRIGRFELANKGTLFLDEVGEIPQELQPKLLRVLQEKEFERLGSARTISVDARLVAATNRNLERMVAERQFRDDLFYRLNVFPITIPPLRERKEDIPLLVRFFANKFARLMKKRIETIPTESVEALQQYHWPGNIRELENFMERAIILAQGTQLQIPLAEIRLPAKAVIPTPSITASSPPEPVSPESSSLESIERDHILRVLRETNWVVGGSDGAAARLGLKRTTLQARMKKLGIGTGDRGQGSGVRGQGSGTSV